MAEIQQATNSADLTQRFIELVMMNAQQAALCLGQMANHSTGKAEVNLQAAQMFIDHLEIIKEKTRGNLNKDEEKILTSVLAELQMAFVQASGGASHVHDENCDHGAHELKEQPQDAEVPSQVATGSESKISGSDEEEGKKRFSKSYGS